MCSRIRKPVPIPVKAALVVALVVTAVALVSSGQVHADTSYFTTLRIEHASSYPSVIVEDDYFVLLRYEAAETLPDAQTESNGAASLYFQLSGSPSPPPGLQFQRVPALGKGIAVVYLSPRAGGWSGLSVRLILNPTQFDPRPALNQSALIPIAACQTCEGGQTASRNALQAELIRQLGVLATSEGRDATHYVDTDSLITTDGETIVKRAYGGFETLLPSLFDVQLTPGFPPETVPTPGPRQDQITTDAEASGFVQKLTYDTARLGLPLTVTAIAVMLAMFAGVLWLSHKISGSGYPALIWINPILLVATLLGLIPIAVIGGLNAILLALFVGLLIKRFLPT